MKILLVEDDPIIQEGLKLAAPECSDEGLTGILQSEIYKGAALIQSFYA